MKKENKITPLPAPVPQVCPECGKEYRDNKWGGCGICSCGYYFHPKWYGRGKKVSEVVMAKESDPEDDDAQLRRYCPICKRITDWEDGFNIQTGKFREWCVEHGEEETEGQEKPNNTVTEDSFPPAPNLTSEEELMKQVNKYGKIK
jgi:endogenous inhibitor of DNA gyrase (YacG/DUF329 family)